MRRWATRALEELYGITDRIMEPEITPVLEGNCRIQGPAEESDHELWGMNSSGYPARKKIKLVDESLHMRVESGTCNMCSAPCSSCLHINRTMSAMESNIDCGSSGHPCVRGEADSCSFVGLPCYKSRICDDLQHAASEASNDTHDSNFENAESKVTRSLSLKREATEDADMALIVPSSDTSEGQLDEKEKVREVLFSPNKTTSMLHGNPKSQDEEQRGLGFHGDNMSCISETRDNHIEVDHHNVELDKGGADCTVASSNNLLANEVDNTTRVETPESSYCKESNEKHNNCRKRRICSEEPLQKIADRANAMPSDKPNLANLRSPIDSPEVHSACFRSQTGHVACSNGDFKDLEGGKNSQLYIDGESSLRRETIAIVDEKTLLSDNEKGKTNHNPCLKAESVMVDNGVLSMEAMKASTVDEKLVTSNSSIELSDVLEIEQQPQLAEGGNSQSEELTDVKICDICGDAGREYLLAFCSRCSDGAEHTYCMREMLHKVPDGDWLCEVCQLMEDAERKKAVSECIVKEDAEVELGKSVKLSGASIECKLKAKGTEKVSGAMIKSKENGEVKKADRSEVLSVSLKDWKSKVDTKQKQVDEPEPVSRILELSDTKKFATASSPKHKTKLDMKEIDVGVRRVFKGLQSPRVSAKRHPEVPEAVQLSSKRSLETSGEPIEIGSPKKRTALSRENSFKNSDRAKARVMTMLPSNEVQSANKPQTLPRSLSLSGPRSPKLQAQSLPPSRFLRQSNSFNNLNSKLKAKQLTESIPAKSGIVRGSMLTDSRKEPPGRSMTKSASFKSVSSVCPNNVSATKSQFVHQSRAEDPRNFSQIKERNVPEKKASILPRSPINSSPRTGSSLPFRKVDMKTAPRDLKMNNLSETSIIKKNKASDSETQKSCLSPKKVIRGISASTDKSHDITYSDLQRGLLKIPDSTHRNGKTKDSDVLRSPKQAVAGGDRVSRCQKCNETGHATRFCSIGKLNSSAAKLSAERSSSDGHKKHNKWKEAVAATISRSRIQKNHNRSDKLQEVAPINLKDIKFNSSSRTEDIPPVVGPSDGHENLRNSDVEAEQVVDVESQAFQLIEASSSSTKQPIESSLAPQGRDLNKPDAALNELNTEPLLHTLPDKASVLGHTFRDAAIPELEFIWQGSLEVLSTGNGRTLFDGIQAHLSNSASRKVPDIATKLPCVVQLEEVSSTSSWPLQSLGICPDEHNVALFFFAKDVESYERSYAKLLKKMLDGDLALGGTINDVELLIFPSNMLPVHCQRWNGLFFLWGIFKGRKNISSSKPSTSKKPSELVIDLNLSAEDLPCDPNNLVPENTIAVENSDSSPLKVLEPTAPLETLAASSPRVEDNMCTVQVSPSVHNTSFKEQSSYSLPLSQSLSSMNQLPHFLDTHSKSSFEVTDAQSCSMVKNGDPYLRNSVLEPGGGYTLASPAHFLATNEQYNCIRESPSQSISSDQIGTEKSMGAKGTAKTEIGMKGEATFYNDPLGKLTDLDQVISERVLNRKHDRSCSMETVSLAFGETMRSDGAISFGKENASYSSSSSPADDDRVPKRQCYGGIASDLRVRSSSKVHPLVPSFLNEHHRESTPTQSIVFPVASSPVLNTKQDSVVVVLSSDDEDEAPDLELALGAKRRVPERPLKLLGGITNDGNKLASLSLSLAFPPPQGSKSSSKAHFQDPPDVNTSLLL